MLFQKMTRAKIISFLLILLMIFAWMPAEAYAAYGKAYTDQFMLYVVGKDGTDVKVGQWTYYGEPDFTLKDSFGNEPSFITEDNLVYSGKDSYATRIAVATKYIKLHDLMDYAGDEMGFSIGDKDSISFKCGDNADHAFGSPSIIGTKYGSDRYYYPSFIINGSLTTNGGIVPAVLAIKSYNERNINLGAYEISDDTSLIKGITYLEGLADDYNAIRLLIGQGENSSEFNLGGESLKWISDVRITPVYYDISVVTNGAVTVTPDDGYFKAASGESVSFTLSGIPSGKKATVTVRDAANNSCNIEKSGNTYTFTMPAAAAAVNVSVADSGTSWDGDTVDVSWYNNTDTVFNINTPAQLMGLAAIVNGGMDNTISTIAGNGGSLPAQDSFKGKTIKLTNDLDMGGVYNSTTRVWSGPNFMPIGGQWRLVANAATDGDGNTTYTFSKSTVGSSNGASFCGTFDGCGHMVKNINCVRELDQNCQSVGLIGRLGAHDGDDASLRPENPAVRNVGVTGYIQGGRSVGGIVGKTGKTTYNNTSPTGIGAMIENCINYATVYAEQKKGVGGIAGAAWNGGIIKNCANMGMVSNKNSNPTGGIAGVLEFPVENCYSAGNVSAGSASYAMALGTIDASNAFFKNCYWLDGSAAGGGIYKSTDRDSATSKTAIEMKSAEFVTALNASGSAFTIDKNNINNGYPILSWQVTNNNNNGGNSGGSSGSSGGGGGGGGSAEPAGNNIVKGDDGKQTAVAVTKATAVTDAAGKAKATVSENTLSGAFKQAKEAAEKADTKAGSKTGSTSVEVKIEVATASNTKGLETTLPAGTLKEMAEQKNTQLTVSSSVAQITLDQKALEAIVNQAGDKVTLSAEKINSSTLPEAARKEIGDAPVYDLKILGANGTVSDFKNGSATVRIPYELKAGETSEQVTVYYINDKGELKKMSCTYDAKTKTAAFTTDHFSYYAVVIEPAVQFTDVSRSAYYYDAVNYAVKKGLFNGTGETSFSPSAGMTRAMFVTVLGRANGVDITKYSQSSFGDVAAGSWYGGYVQWAYENGIVSGMNKDQFAPDQQITRNQMAAILTNYCKWKKMGPNGEVAQLTYTDLSQVPDWALEGVSFCTEKGWLTGYTDGSFQGQKTATRAEAATVLYKASSSGVL